MSQILRIIKPEIVQIRRFYRSHRNLQNHYETLRIPPDASAKDVRLAFIKLSKEMHPDTSKRTSESDFVRVNEAYQILSKAHTRSQYDMELRHRAAGNGRQSRVVYYESARGWNPRQGPMSEDPNDYGDGYYGIKGIKRVSNVTLAILCIAIGAIGLSFQLLVISNSVAARRERVMDKMSKLQEEYRKVRAEAMSRDEQEQIMAIRQKLAANDANNRAKEHN